MRACLNTDAIFIYADSGEDVVLRALKAKVDSSDLLLYFAYRFAGDYSAAEQRLVKTFGDADETIAFKQAGLKKLKNAPELQAIEPESFGFYL